MGKKRHQAAIVLAAGLIVSESPAALAQAGPANAVQASDSISDMRRALAEARALIAQQSAQIKAQDERLQLLEQRLDGVARIAQQAAATPAPAPSTGQAPGRIAVAPNPAQGIEEVGQAPADQDRPPELAVLGDQGSVVTRKGQLTAEFQADYTRADRNRAVFRGVELIESVLVGVFDINESRQDVLTSSAALRYGVTNRLEVGARIPFVYRSDKSVLAPIAGSTNNDDARTIDNSANGSGIGDLELSARYQITNGGNGNPFLIANLQGIIPTGKSPFKVPRDENGDALEAATGAGFYGISPSLTAILPTDPAVLFGTLGYTFNLGDDVDTRIPPVIIERVDPGDAISASAGIGISLNQRTSVNFGYAHSWAFGTKTWTRLLDPKPGQEDMVTTTRSRDLQIGRLLFGVSYRVSDRSSINWSVEVGATEDAPDVRTTLRLPFVF